MKDANSNTTSTVDHATLPSANTEELYYLRCAGDGSWLTNRGGDHRGIFAFYPDDVARLTAEELENIGFDRDSAVYQWIPVSKALHEHVTEYLDSTPRQINEIMARVRTRCPFRLEYFEIASMLDAMVKSGAVDVTVSGAVAAFRKGEYLNHCAECGAVLESHGDCSSKDCDSHKGDAETVLREWSEPRLEDGVVRVYCGKQIMFTLGEQYRSTADAIRRSVNRALAAPSALFKRTILDELSEDLSSAVVRCRSAIEGNGDIVDAAVELVTLLEQNARPHGSGDAPEAQAEAMRVGLDFVENSLRSALEG